VKGCAFPTFCNRKKFKMNAYHNGAVRLPRVFSISLMPVFAFMVAIIFELAYASTAVAANRYWVGGTDSWNTTAGTKWALTSGGTGGQAVPTSADDVFIDAASGAVTVTATTSVGWLNVKNLDFSGFTGILAGSSSLEIYGSLTMGAGMTVTHFV